jgi:hypothetical protein
MKNVGYRLTLACHNRRRRRGQRRRRRHRPRPRPRPSLPRLHREPGLTLQIDFDSIENVFLQKKFFQNFIQNRICDHLMQSLLV